MKALKGLSIVQCFFYRVQEKEDTKGYNEGGSLF